MMQSRKEICLDLIEYYPGPASEAFKGVITCDETWVYHYDLSSKQGLHSRRLFSERSLARFAAAVGTQEQDALQRDEEETRSLSSRDGSLVFSRNSKLVRRGENSIPVTRGLRSPMASGQVAAEISPLPSGQVGSEMSPQSTAPPQLVPVVEPSPIIKWSFVPDESFLLAQGDHLWSPEKNVFTPSILEDAFSPFPTLNDENKCINLPLKLYERFVPLKVFEAVKDPMSCYSLGRMIKKIEKTSSLEAKPRCGRHASQWLLRFRIILKLLKRYPHIEKTPRIFIKKYPYKIQRFRELKVGDFEKRQEFASWVFRKIDIDVNWLSNALWTDEAHLSLNGEVSSQNTRIWATGNTRNFTEMPLHQTRVTV
ncbi:hypothetical protein LAZ67_1001739 [Cordylochernes scorpioides]|uniref:Transposase n=1 Tax=Cordylochernes scorpioides TaxID=51811 RepID=A0ABY6JX22_9ARAC|nr:hypothetical protein LAZ67_1001739 [Cordylochernes scorpioides]